MAERGILEGLYVILVGFDRAYVQVIEGLHRGYRGPDVYRD